MIISKKVFICSVIFTVFITMLLGLAVYPVFAEQPNFDLTAKSAILMEAETGEIIFEKNPHQELPPASMTKLMTMLIALEAIEDGKADLQDKLVVSEKAASMGGSQVYLEPGEEMTLEDMMKSISISSANDASVAVAEYLYGTEEDFVDRMNERADELGLDDTYYYNTNGLPPGNPDIQGNYTSAYDLAVLAREVLKHPIVLDWSSTWIDYLRDGDFVLNNTNRLVRHYKGADGLKTGYTSEAKFCVTSTAKRDGIRFIAVIMGADSSKTRFAEAAKLLSFGFNTFDAMDIVKKDDVIKEINIWNAKQEQAQIVVPETVTIPVRKGEKEQINKKLEVNGEIKAPLEKGDKVGEIKVYKGNLLLKKVDLVINRDVEKASIWQMVIRILRHLYMNLINLFL